MSERDWSKIKFFTPEEWGPQPRRVDWALIELADQIRAAAEAPMHLHCSWAESGHAAKSYHYSGLAVDFHFGPGPAGWMTPLEEFGLLSSFREVGGLGFYPGWGPRPGWHLDLRTGPRKLWVRTMSGDYLYGPREMSRALWIYEQN